MTDRDGNGRGGGTPGAGSRWVTARWLWIWGTVVAAVGFAGFTVLDGPVYHAVGPTLETRARLDGELWYLGLRHVGTVWAWLAVGALVVLVDWARRGRGAGGAAAGPVWRRGAFVAAGAAAGGLGAELAKLVIGRERPATIESVNGVEALVYQGYEWRGMFSGFLDGSNLGLPSSHAATAMGGAAALWVCFPRAGWLAVLAAVGCGVTRILTGAHFATDVYAGFLLAAILVWVMRRPFGVRAGKGTAAA